MVTYEFYADGNIAQLQKDDGTRIYIDMGNPTEVLKEDEDYDAIQDLFDYHGVGDKSPVKDIFPENDSTPTEISDAQRHEIWCAGQNDTLIESLICEEAERFACESLGLEGEEIIDEAMEVYRDGFLSRNEPLRPSAEDFIV